MAFLTQNKANFCKILIITLVFENNANFFAENCLKSQKNCDHNIDPRVTRFVFEKIAQNMHCRDTFFCPRDTFTVKKGAITILAAYVCN
jgi:hypothetical protein